MSMARWAGSSRCVGEGEGRALEEGAAVGVECALAQRGPGIGVLRVDHIAQECRGFRRAAGDFPGAQVVAVAGTGEEPRRCCLDSFRSRWVDGNGFAILRVVPSGRRAGSGGRRSSCRAPRWDARQEVRGMRAHRPRGGAQGDGLSSTSRPNESGSRGRSAGITAGAVRRVGRCDGGAGVVRSGAGASEVVVSLPGAWASGSCRLRQAAATDTPRAAGLARHDGQRAPSAHHTGRFTEIRPLRERARSSRHHPMASTSRHRVAVSGRGAVAGARVATRPHSTCNGHENGGLGPGGARGRVRRRPNAW